MKRILSLLNCRLCLLALMPALFMLLSACGGGGGGGGGGSVSGDELPVELGLPGPGDTGNYFPLNIGDFWHFQGTFTSGGDVFDYQNTVNVSGTKVVDGISSMVVRESNSYGEGLPYESYLVKDLNGIATVGTDDLDPFSAQLAPYWKARFPLIVGEGFVQLDRAGLDFGEDLDGDFINETVDIRSVVTVLTFGTVTVPAGVFADAVEIQTSATLKVRRSSDGVAVTATATERAWFAAEIGWVKRSYSMSMLGMTETATEELDLYSVAGQTVGITPLDVSLLDDQVGAGQSNIYAYPTVSETQLTVVLTGLTGEVMLVPYLPAICDRDNTWLTGTEPKDCSLTAAGTQLVMAVESLAGANYTLSVAITPTVAVPVNEGTSENPVLIDPHLVTAGKVATRGTSYYAATGLPLNTYTVSISGLSGNAGLHVYADETYSLELDCTMRPSGDEISYPQECTVANTTALHFSVSSSPLNRDGATYNMLIH